MINVILIYVIIFSYCVSYLKISQYSCKYSSTAILYVHFNHVIMEAYTAAGLQSGTILCFSMFSDLSTVLYIILSVIV